MEIGCIGLEFKVVWMEPLQSLKLDDLDSINGSGASEGKVPRPLETNTFLFQFLIVAVLLNKCRSVFNLLRWPQFLHDHPPHTRNT